MNKHEMYMLSALTKEELVKMLVNAEAERDEVLADVERLREALELIRNTATQTAWPLDREGSDG